MHLFSVNLGADFEVGLSVSDGESQHLLNISQHDVILNR